MAVTPLRLVGPELLSNAAATVYTVPALTKTVVRHIHLSNPTGSPVDFTMSIGTDAAATRVYSGLAVPADSAMDIWCYHVLEAAEVVQAFAGTDAVLNITVNGDERT